MALRTFKDNYKKEYEFQFIKRSTDPKKDIFWLTTQVKMTVIIKMNLH